MATKDIQLKLKEVDGDLFSSPNSYSLAHCVTSDMGMGAGIAVKFRDIFGQVDKLRSQGIKTGGVAVLKDNERYIYYLVTKEFSHEKPSYFNLRSSLNALRDHMMINCITQLAIPRIGCGIDGLEWDKVKCELINTFNQDNIEIVVYNFVPK